MPTNRPRLTITLTPRINQALTAFSEGTGESRSSFILQVLEQSLPALEKMAQVVQAARRAKPEALAALKSDMDRLYRTSVAAHSLMQDAMGLFDGEGAQGNPPPSRSAGGGRSTGSGRKDPPLSNRGGRSPRSSGKVVPLKPGGGGRAR